MTYDFVVVGAGMAGISLAAHLAEHASVCVLDMESQPGYHSTGRSAALFAESYGNSTIRALTRAGRRFFFSPPEDIAAAPLVSPRSVLFTARENQLAALERFLAGSGAEIPLERIAVDAAAGLLPILRTEGLQAAALDRNSADIDVHGLLQGFLRRFKARGGLLRTSCPLHELDRGADGWRIRAGSEALVARVLVNAAGAWADEVAKLAAVASIDLKPLRRSACLIDAPAGSRVAEWPMLIDVDEQYYLKPDAGRLLLSPADETPAEPGDAQADDLDIAIAVDRIEQATTLRIGRVQHQWAGLRSFVADRSPVVGYDPLRPGFFWHAALGGYGIQTAPALGRVAASLALGRRIDPDLEEFGIDVAGLSPARLKTIAA